MSVHEIRHPLVQHKLGLLRQNSLSTRSFRQLTAEVGSLLTYEATSDLELEDYQVETWMGKAPAQRIKGKKITVVPILRAGLGMLDGVLELIPSAKVSVVGVYRDEATLEPVAYFEKLAHDIGERMALVIDPMLHPDSCPGAGGGAGRHSQGSGGAPGCLTVYGFGGSGAE